MASDPFLVAVVWGSAAVVGISAVAAWRQRPKPGATAFAVAMFAATWWVVAASIGLFTTDAAVRLFWAKVEWAGVVAFPVAWAVFALAYTGRSERITVRSIGFLSALPAVTLALALTNGVGQSLLYRSTSFEAFGTIGLLHRSFGPWFWVHVAYSTLLLVAGGVLIVQLVADRRPLYRGQATALVLVVAAPLVGRAVYVAGHSPVTAFDPTPYTFVVSGAAGLAALTQFSFLDAVPVTNRVARRSVVENVDAGVLVADTEDHVVDANPRAVELLTGVGANRDTPERAQDETTVVGTRLPDWLRAVSVGDAPDPEGGDNGEAVTAVDHPTGRRHYAVRATALRDGYGIATGRIYLVRDVTDRQARLQRLSVLNRVLRHNLRNEMTVVHGLADGLVREERDPAVVADTIRTRATDLVDLADKVREVDALLDGNADDPPTDVCRIVDIECGRIADEYPDADVSAATPAGPVFTDAVAGPVVRNLVENAAVHNAADDPRIRVAVSVADDRATVVVTDDGPGIPAGERAALDARLETQLDHASGLGLWLASWGTTSVGGDLDVADRDPTGTEVTATFPVVDAASADRSGGSGDVEGRDRASGSTASGSTASGDSRTSRER